MVIGYHIGSAYPFYTAEAAQRATYYSVGGTPIIKIDGILTQSGGSATPATDYSIYRREHTNRVVVSSPLTIDLTCTYDSLANSGTVYATVTNTSPSTVNGNIHFVVIENRIPYNWYGLTQVDHVCRDMLPNASGEAISVPAGGNISRNRSFTIDGTWNENNCYIVVFVQGSSREIYQGSEIGIMAKPNMDYYGMTFVEQSGNGNRIAQPGETIRMYVKGKNNASGSYPGGALVTTSDPYITINSTSPQSVAIAAGDVDTVQIVTFTISSGCPVPRTVAFNLNFGTPGDTNTVYFMITNTPGFSDNMELGQGAWTHYGDNDNWHLSTYYSHSPITSWYCGVEATHQYTDRNTASLISPRFVATPDSALRFWHRYGLEPAYDYAYCEIDNNMGWWQILGIYNGTQNSWTQPNIPLNAFAGQTVRLRFRFISDHATIDQGWYIDDVSVPIIVGTEENNITEPDLFQITPNPFTTVLHIDSRSPMVSTIKIYDASGRTVREFELPAKSSANWTGRDDENRQLPAGIYFVNISNAQDEKMEKVLLLK